MVRIGPISWLVAVSLLACGKEATQRGPHGTAITNSPPKPVVAPKRELMGSRGIDRVLHLEHFKFVSETAASALTKRGAACRESNTVTPDTFVAQLETCLGACDEGDMPSCVIAADWLLHSRGNEAGDRPRALELYERACRSKQDPIGCLILGEQLDRGANVTPHEPARAKVMWQLGCNQGEPNSCAALNDERFTVETTTIYEAPKDTKH